MRLPRSTIEEVLAAPLPRSVLRGTRQEPPTPGLSLVVVSYNNLPYNRLCLESVLADTTLRNYEIVAVDNGSSDGTADYLQELAKLNPHVRVLLNRDNRGFAAACNQGLAAAIGKVFVLLNNDTIVPGETLTRLIGRLDDPTVGMVGPVTNRCGNEAQIETSYETWGELLEFTHDRTCSHRNREFQIPMLAMYCVAIKREVYEQIGKLDEQFEIGLFEDEDYCTRLTGAGYQLICMEDVFIHHFGQASIGKLAASGQYGELFHRNRQKYEAKWSRKWTPHQQRSTRQYRSLVEQLRQAVESAAPVDSTVLIVSRGDQDLLTLAGRMAWHFPMSDDGRYAGHHPGSSSEAIEQLERLREDGGQFLVIPAPMFWWLEYYSEFAAHLARRYRCTEHEGVCLIYRLASFPADFSEFRFSICAQTRGISRLTRRLVTIVWPIGGSHRQTVRLLAGIPHPGSYPHRVLLVYPNDADERTRALLEKFVDRDKRVAIAASATAASEVSALNVGLRLAPGDVVLADPSAGAGERNLENLCTRAQKHEQAGTVSLQTGNGGEICRFIRRAALCRVGLLDEKKFTGLAGAWGDFRDRMEARDFPHFSFAAEEKDDRARTDRPTILILVHDGAGGSRVATWELARAASASVRCLLLQAALSSWSLYEAAGGGLDLVGHYRFSDRWRLSGEPGIERESVLRAICDQFGVSLVNIHHLLCTGPRIIDSLKCMNLPVVVSFHDFYTICPTAHLIDNDGNFCGGRCSPGAGLCPVDKAFIKDSQTELKHDYVYRHRHAMNQALAQADAFTAPSFSTRNRLLGALEALRAEDFQIIGHGCDFDRRELAAEPLNERPARIVCPGNLNEAKGIGLIRELMNRNVENGHPFEFHFLGQRPRAFDPEELGGICHGAYERADFMDHLAEIAPSFSLIASLCEETYSYTLSESWAAGLPVFASDRGALKERIERHGGGWLLNPENPAQFYLGMLAALETPGAWKKQVDSIREIPLPGTREETESMMRLFDGCLRRAALLPMAEPAG